MRIVIFHKSIIPISTTRTSHVYRIGNLSACGCANGTTTLRNGKTHATNLTVVARPHVEDQVLLVQNYNRRSLSILQEFA